MFVWITYQILKMNIEQESFLSTFNAGFSVILWVGWVWGYEIAN